MLHLFSEHRLDLPQVAGGDRALCSRDRGSVIHSSGLQAGVRCTLAGAVKTHGRFNEGTVGERLCIRSESTDLCGLRKRRLHLQFTGGRVG